ncbi:MAG: site-specific integrase [Bacteroidota bacterium]
MNKLTAQIAKLEHRGEKHIKVIIPNTPHARQRIKSVTGRKFSRTHRCWYIPNTFAALEELKQHFRVEALEPLNSRTPPVTNLPKTTTPTSKEATSSNNANTVTSYGFTGQKIRLEKVNAEWIKAFVPYDKKGWIEVIRNVIGRKWDANGKFWLLPNVKNTFRFLKKEIGLKYVDIRFKVEVDIPEHFELPIEQKKRNQKRLSFFEKLNDNQQTAIKQLEQALILKRLSYSTQKTYKHHLAGLFYFHKKVTPEAITTKQVQQYLLHQIKFKKIAESTQNQIINAIKAYWEKVLKRDKSTIEIPRPKKPKKLPNVLSTDEVFQLLSALENIKHKLLLLLIYSAGLRRSEVLNLLKRDINVKRRAIHIKGAKGKKDRYVVLAEVVIPHLDNYLKQYRPTNWLFEGQNGGKYSATSLQKVFHKAVKISKVNPYITLHTLRHSYATHCIEQGHNVKYVQEALGHSSIKTTEIYIHLSSDALRKLKSPIDNMDL